MLITRLYLRNFRVYESELEVELPPGLVGIYGPNGAGKSTLLEAVVWTLWGRARTGKEEIRSSGVGGDCVTEVEFEHEGHLYLVRRTVSGAAATVRAEAHCDGLIVSEGVRDSARYLHSVLGMDDAAFRASVFAEQKQLAAFSSQTPAERRRLVLQLLGITPLDGARDSARREARSAAEQHQRLRGMLPDLDQLAVAAADADARAGAVEARAVDAEAAAAAAAARAAEADDAFRRLDTLRQEYDALVIEGRAAASELKAAVAAVASLEDELRGLDVDARDLTAQEQGAAGLAEAEARLRALEPVVAASAELERVEVPPEPPAPDEDAAALASRRAADAQAAVAQAEGALSAAEAELGRARQLAERSAGLSDEADCPLCGQELGAAFQRVQQHRAEEVTSAEMRVAGLVRRREAAQHAFDQSTAAASQAAAELRSARHARQEWERAAARRADADTRRQAAVAALAITDAALAQEAAAGSAAARRALQRVQEDVEGRRRAEATASRLRVRLERRPQVVSALEAARLTCSDAEQAVTALRDKVKALGHDPAALDAARRVHEEATAGATDAARQATSARLVAVEERARAEGEARRLAEGRRMQAQLTELETDSRHLGRLADLLNAFRNSVVSTVGPRLALQAAELFGELTDNEYDQLEVDPETYQLKISDGGHVYGLERFSGSEVDLANLALRVAISEHVRFQSGGSVGLLVLDEVFGPLDEERKARMLLALERLRSRFRQILVVTHDSEIKEQLPSAIEVVKRPGRRATARLLV